MAAAAVAAFAMALAAVAGCGPAPPGRPTADAWPAWHKEAQRFSGPILAQALDEMTEIVKTFSTVADYWLSDQKRSTELQLKLGKAFLDLWGSSMRRMAGEETAAVIHI